MRRVGREQRVTLRLSRQRPGRVRQRERTDESAQERKPRQWRDLTVLASLLAVLLTVPGTVWAVLVAQDQLNQSEENAVKEERAQASRVSAWTSQGPHGKWTVHLMNRSPDPIADVYLSFEPLTVDAPQYAWNVTLMSVPPCTDMTISQDQLRYPNTRRPMDRLAAFNLPQISPHFLLGWTRLTHVRAYMMVPMVAFTDRNGLPWQRRHGHLSRRTGQITAAAGYQGVVMDQPAVETVDECGDDAGS